MILQQRLRPLKDAQLRALRDRVRGMSLSRIAFAHGLACTEVEGWSSEPRFVRAVEEAIGYPDELRLATAAELVRRQAARRRRAHRRVEARIRRDREAREQMWWVDRIP